MGCRVQVFACRAKEGENECRGCMDQVRGKWENGSRGTGKLIGKRVKEESKGRGAGDGQSLECIGWGSGSEFRV